MRLKFVLVAAAVFLFVLFSLQPAAQATREIPVEGAINRTALEAGGGSGGGAAPEIVDEGGPFERIIAGLIEFPIRVVKAAGIGLLKLKPINELVFGTPAGDGSSWHNHSIWTESEARFIRAVYWAFASVCLPLFLIVIAVTAFKLMHSAASPPAREEAVGSIWRWFAVLVMVLAVPLVTDLVLALAGVLTDAVRMAFEGVSRSLGLGVTLGDYSSGIFSGDLDIRTGSVLGTALVKVFFVFVWLQFNIVYFIRKVVLSAMVCFAPVAGLFWAINRNVPAVAIWFGELGSNALMPVAHAIVLCVIMGLADLRHVTDKGTWFHLLIAIYMLMPLAEVVRNSVQSLFIRWAGVDEAGLASKATMAAFGLGGLLGLGRLAGTFMPAFSGPQQFPGGDYGWYGGWYGSDSPWPGGPRPGGLPYVYPGGYGAAAAAAVPLGFYGSSPFYGAAVSGYRTAYRTAGPGGWTGSPVPGAAQPAGDGPAGAPAGYAAGEGSPAGGIPGSGPAPGAAPPPETGSAPGAGAGAETGRLPGTGAGLPQDRGVPPDISEKPLPGRVVDGVTGITSAAVGGVAGWTVRAAAHAVPGMGGVGNSISHFVEAGAAGLTRGAAAALTAAARWGWDRSEKGYITGGAGLLRGAADFAAAVRHTAAGRMEPSDIIYASTLGEAVRQAPRYSAVPRGLE